MSSPHENEMEPRITELLANLTDGEITQAEQQQLMELLREHPAAREQYLDHLHLHAMLHWVEAPPPVEGTQLMATAREVMPVEPSPPAAPIASVSPVLTGRFGNHPLAYSLAAAGITAVAWMLLIALISSHREQVVPDSAPPMVARLTGELECRWAGDQQGPPIGKPLPIGRRLNLRAGLAEVTFYDGARVVLKGPASLTLLGRNCGSLERGHLAAVVPPEAVGFTVSTPSAVVVDLSTEFAVQVHDQDTTDVHVFRGRVQVTQLTDLEDQQESPPEHLLTANNALRVTRHNGESHALPIDPAQRLALDSGKRFIAYHNHEIAPGQQETLTTLGHDFVVNETIAVTQLGVFDSGADGLRRIITAELWSRDDRGTPDDFGDDQALEKLATMTFTPVNPGMLIESSCFKSLPAKVVLRPGSYTIVAYGYGPHEPFGNSNYADDAQYKSVDDGNGALSFVGTARFGDKRSQPHTTYPLTVGKGPANRYRAGTFEFEVLKQLSTSSTNATDSSSLPMRSEIRDAAAPQSAAKKSPSDSNN